MGTWNRTAWIKTVIVALLALPNLFLPVPEQPEFNLLLCLGAFLFGGLFMYLVTRYNLFVLDRGLTEPIWNDNPLDRKTPLAFFQFLGWVIAASGISLVIGTAFYQKETSSFGLIAISFGFGLILGMYLVARRKRNQL